MLSHVSILPQDVLDSLLIQLDASHEHESLRFLRLPHPRTGVTSLYLPYQSSETHRSSIAEVQVVAPTNERSWFMPEGMVLENGKLLMMTPVDPAFLLIPLLRATMPGESSPGTFRPLDDVFEHAVGMFVQSPPTEANPKDASSMISSDDLMRFCALECARKAMRRVCEVKEITPEITVYRYSQDKVIEMLKEKVTRLVSPDVFESSNTLIRNLAKEGLMEDGKEKLLDVGRLRAACDLVSQYLPPSVFNALLASYDFAALTTYLKDLADEAAAAAAVKMDKIEARESKTTAAANDKKRKSAAKASMGVEKLKKASTKGMAKMSSFFQPKAVS